jgi:hypothetical protein
MNPSERLYKELSLSSPGWRFASEVCLYVDLRVVCSIIAGVTRCFKRWLVLFALVWYRLKIWVSFTESRPTQEYCTVKLDARNIKAFKYAIKHHYWYQMYIDDLPAWALVGDYGEGHDDTTPHSNTEDAYIFTHRRIDIGYNGNHIVEFNVTAGKRAKLVEGETLHFSYQVRVQTLQFLKFLFAYRPSPVCAS